MVFRFRVARPEGLRRAWRRRGRPPTPFAKRQGVPHNLSLEWKRPMGKLPFPRCIAAAALAILSVASIGVGQAPTGKSAFAFRDVGDETGLFPHLAGIRGHGVAWGDTR